MKYFLFNSGNNAVIVINFFLLSSVSFLLFEKKLFALFDIGLFFSSSNWFTLLEFLLEFIFWLWFKSVFLKRFWEVNPLELLKLFENVFPPWLLLFDLFDNFELFEVVLFKFLFVLLLLLKKFSLLKFS